MRKALALILLAAMALGTFAIAEQFEVVPIETVEANPVKETTPTPTVTPRVAASPRPTAAPEATVRTKTTATPEPTVRTKTTATPEPTVRSKTTATPEPTVRTKTAATPEPTVRTKTTAAPTSAPTSESSAGASPATTQEALSIAEVSVGHASTSAVSRLMADTQGETKLSVGGLFAGGSTVLGSDIPRAAITSVRFESSTVGAPVDAWDVSEARDGSVIAWVTQDGALTIAAEGGVRANQDCSHLFAGYASATSIDFNGSFFTDDATSMAHMFESCWSLTALDVSGMNTANVTDMSYMFSSCVELASLELSGLNTGLVRSMEGMFLMDEKLSALDLSGFDGSSLKDISSMFEGCSGLEQLDLSKLRLVRTVDMRNAFGGCAKLSEVSFGSELLSTRADTSGMFADCPAKLKLDGVEVDAAEWSNLSDYAQLKLWSRGDGVRWLQTKLAAAGSDPGEIDGVFGHNTENALRDWQSSHGYEATGLPDAEQVWALFRQD